ncbi:MAG: hypothetical protein NZ951_07680 [Dehalococcoidia bacterium]|nr:hypothetical protein [Dehalococcoidia bacterium]
MRYRSPLMLGAIAVLSAVVGVLAGLLATQRPAWATSPLALPRPLSLGILGIGMALILAGYGALLLHTWRVGRSPSSSGAGSPAPLGEMVLVGIPLLVLIGVVVYALLSS